MSGLTLEEAIAYIFTNAKAMLADEEDEAILLRVAHAADDAILYNTALAEKDAEIESVRSELDAYKAMDCKLTVLHTDHLAAERAAYEKGVRDCAAYMEHQPPCPFWDDPAPGCVCSCGLDPLLALLAAPTEEE